MKRLKYRKRTATEKIVVVIKDVKKINLREFKRACRLRGDYDTGYHYLLHPNGLLEADRNEDSVAYYKYSDYETSIYILAHTHCKKLSEAQILTLDKLAKVKGVEWQVYEEA